MRASASVMCVCVFLLVGKWVESDVSAAAVAAVAAAAVVVVVVVVVPERLHRSESC